MGTLAALGGISLGGQLIGGLIGADAQRDSARMMARAQMANIARLNKVYADLSPYYQKIIDQLPMEDQIKALQNWSPVTMEDYGTYNPATDVQAWLDPSIAYQQEQALESIQAAQAARGGLKSGGALKELQDRAQNIGMLGWQNAQTASYQDYVNRFNAYRSANDQTYNQLQNLANMGTGAINSLSNLATGNVNAVNAANTAMAGYDAYGQNVMQNTMGQAFSNAFSPQNVGAFYQAMQTPTTPATNYNAYGQTMMESTPYVVPSTQQSGINPYFTGSSQYFDTEGGV